MKWRDDLLVASRESAEALFGASPVAMQFGGTTIWSADEKTLLEAVDLMQRQIEDTLGSHLSVAPQVLKKAVRDGIGADAIDDKVFSAMLGAVLRFGKADAAICVSPNDVPFRIYVAARQLSNWQRAKVLVVDKLIERGALTVPECESILFGKRAYNTWSSSSHVLQHLSYVGVAEMVDKDSCRLVRGLV